MANSPVTEVGKYQIIELVGEGAMGNVYRALDPLLNRTVAIKVMSDAIARDGALRDRFMREAQAAGSLQHPHVVTIYDFGEVDGHLYIAMEYVEGVDLERIIDEHVPLSLDHKLGIAIDVLLGLGYAHRHGIVHRDIKPANIRITEEGHAKIMDFGVAHLESTRMTATGVMVGTPNYMAPEQVTGQKIGPPTDIFATGAVLYELLARRKAFAGDSLHNVLFKVVSEDPPPLAMLVPELPRELDAVLQRAMAKDAENRYQTAQEMANDLTAIRAALSPGTSSPSLSLGATIAARTAERRAASAKEAPQGRWKTGRIVTWGVAAALVLVSGTWMYASRQRGASGGPSSETALTPTGTTIPPAPVPLARDTAAPVPARDSGREASVRSKSVIPAPGATPSNSALASDERELSAMVTQLRASSMRVRTGAEGAGATVTGLAAGDARLATADRYVREKRYADAVTEMNAASVMWSNAETAARRAATREDSMARAAAQETTVTRGAPPPDVPTVAPPRVSQSAASRGEPTRTEESSAPVEIAALIGDYARAIEARDIAAVKAVYPSLTASQQQGFERFFSAVRSLRTSLSAGTPNVTGNTATAEVRGTYDYIDSSGSTQRQAVAFHATFRRDGGRWRIESVR